MQNLDTDLVASYEVAYAYTGTLVNWILDENKHKYVQSFLRFLWVLKVFEKLGLQIIWIICYLFSFPESRTANYWGIFDHRKRYWTMDDWRVHNRRRADVCGNYSWPRPCKLNMHLQNTRENAVLGDIGGCCHSRSGWRHTSRNHNCRFVRLRLSTGKINIFSQVLQLK